MESYEDGIEEFIVRIEICGKCLKRGRNVLVIDEKLGNSWNFGILS